MKTNSIRLNRTLLLTCAASFSLLAQTLSAQQWTTNSLPSGLIAWWPAEGNMLDSAGVHDGGGSAAPTYAPGRFGQAFQFNGIDQSVAIPDVHAELDSWTQFTLEAWINLDLTADFAVAAPGRSIFSKVGHVTDHVNYNQGYQFGPYDNATKIALAFNAAGQAWPGFTTVADLGVPLLTNTWYHLVGTYDHNAVKIYLNGVPLVTNVIGPVTLQDSGSSLRLSKDDNLNCPFAGRIDDARIYNRALSGSEIAFLSAGPDLPVTQGLKLHLDASDVNAGGNPVDGAPVTHWRDLSGLGLDATQLFAVSPVYRRQALNGRAGVDFSRSGSDALATAFSSEFSFTNCTVFMVANGAASVTHVSISAPGVMQEFILGDKAIYHHSSPYHWVHRSHQDTPAGYYLQAGLFGTRSNELANCINGVVSTERLFYSSEIGQSSPVADYVPVPRQVILGWRNSDALGNAPIPGENLSGVICEVLVYDRLLSMPEVDAVNAFLGHKYSLPVTPIPPVLELAPAAEGTVTLQWAATTGRYYQLQSATKLAVAAWTDEGAPFRGTGGVLSTNMLSGSGSAKFFRLLVVEP